MYNDVRCSMYGINIIGGKTRILSSIRLNHVLDVKPSRGGDVDPCVIGQGCPVGLCPGDPWLWLACGTAFQGHALSHQHLGVLGLDHKTWPRWRGRMRRGRGERGNGVGLNWVRGDDTFLLGFCEFKGNQYAFGGQRMCGDHLCIFLSRTALWVLLKQHPTASHSVVASEPYLACDYSGVKGNMYTARGPGIYNHTETGNAQHLFRETGVLTGDIHHLELTSGHTQTAHLISHCDNYWYRDVLARFKCVVWQTLNIYTERNRTEFLRPGPCLAK